MAELNSTGTTTRAWAAGDEVLVINEGGGSPDTIARVNSGIPVSALAGAVLNNFTATTAPTVNEDSGDGYAVGSRWLWPARGLEWVCVDAAVGAARWVQMNDAHYGEGALRLPRRTWSTDFLEHNGTTGSIMLGGRWMQNLFGSGTILPITDTFGVRMYTTGTGTSGTSGFFPVNNGNSVLPDPGVTHRFRARCALNPTGYDFPPDATNDYAVRIGFIQDGPELAGQLARFVYRFNAGAVEFLAQTRNGGTITSTSLSLPSSNVWATYEIVINGSANVQFYINGAIVATHTTNLPTLAMYDAVNIRKSVGTAVRAFIVDWVEYSIT